MKNKNILCLVLCIALVLNITCFTVFADDNVTVSVVNKVIYEDMTSFDVQIKLTSNPGIAALGFDVGYDQDVMELTGVTNGSIFDNDDITEGVIWNNPYTVSCMTPYDNIYTTGTLVTLHFELHMYSDEGSYDITIHNAEAFRLDETEVDVSALNGTVTVKEITHNKLSVTGTRIIVDEEYMTAKARVNITANPGIAVVGFDIEYNDNYFRLRDIYEEEFWSELPLTYGDFGKNPYTVLAYNEHRNTRDKGHFLTLIFDVYDIPENDEYLTLSNAEAFNYDEEEVMVNLINNSDTQPEMETKIEMSETHISDEKVSITVESIEEIPENAAITAVMYGQGNRTLNTQFKEADETVDFSFDNEGEYIKVFVMDIRNLRPLSKPLYLSID